MNRVDIIKRRCIFDSITAENNTLKILILQLG